MRDRKSRTLRRKREGKKARLLKQEGPLFTVTDKNGNILAEGSRYKLESIGYNFSKLL